MQEYVSAEKVRLAIMQEINSIYTFDCSDGNDFIKEDEKVSATLNKIAEEDPTIDWYRNSETKQALIGGQGELHINIVKDKMKEKQV